MIVSLCPGFTVSTVTDVLRVAYTFSGGDPSIPAIPKKLKKKGKKYGENIKKDNDRITIYKETIKKQEKAFVFFYAIVW